MSKLHQRRYKKTLFRSGLDRISRANTFFDRHLHTFLLIPGLVVIFGILIYPVTMNIFYSFTNKHLILPRVNFIGFENYLRVFQDETFITAVSNTIVWTVGSIVLQVVLGMITALMLKDSKGPGTAVFRVLLLLPYALPPITVALMWRWMLNSSFGVINKLLMNINAISAPISWLSSISFAMPTAIIINVWWGVSLFTISFIAGFQSIPSEHYEVAAIEGAKGYQTFIHVTMPGIKQIFGVMLILRIIWVFNSFDILFLLTGGGPLQKTSTLPIYSYYLGWKSQALGRASSVAVILFIFLMMLMTIYFKIADIEGED